MKKDKILTFADKAKAIQDKYKLRTKDPLAIQSMDREMEALMLQQEEFKEKQKQKDLSRLVKKYPELAAQQQSNQGMVTPNQNIGQSQQVNPQVELPQDQQVEVPQMELGGRIKYDGGGGLWEDNLNPTKEEYDNMWNRDPNNTSYISNKSINTTQNPNKLVGILPGNTSQEMIKSNAGYSNMTDMQKAALDAKIYFENKNNIPTNTNSSSNAQSIIADNDNPTTVNPTGNKSEYTNYQNNRNQNLLAALPGAINAAGNAYLASKVRYDRISPNVTLQENIQLDPTQAALAIYGKSNATQSALMNNANSSGNAMSNLLANSAVTQNALGATYSKYAEDEARLNAGIQGGNRSELNRINSEVSIRNADIQSRELQDKLGYQAASMTGIAQSISGGYNDYLTQRKFANDVMATDTPEFQTKFDKNGNPVRYLRSNGYNIVYKPNGGMEFQDNNGKVLPNQKAADDLAKDNMLKFDAIKQNNTPTIVVDAMNKLSEINDEAEYNTIRDSYHRIDKNLIGKLPDYKDRKKK